MIKKVQSQSNFEILKSAISQEGHSVQTQQMATNSDFAETFYIW